MGRGQLCLNSSVKIASAGCTDGQRSRSQTRGEAVTQLQFRKSHILGKCIVFEQCAMLSKRLKSTVACCYETYRMRREGKVESPSHFAYCCDISTDRHRGCGGVCRGS